MELTEQHEKFCQLYVKTGNASQSYIDAGFECSEKSAPVLGHRLLRKVNISLRVSYLQTKQANRIQVNTDMIVNKLVNIVFEGSKIAEIDENGELKLIPFSDPSEADSLSFSKSESQASGHSKDGSNDSSSESTSISIKNKDKIKALDMLCKILGVYDRKQDGDSGKVFENNSKRVLDVLERTRRANKPESDNRES